MKLYNMQFSPAFSYFFLSSCIFLRSVCIVIGQGMIPSITQLVLGTLSPGVKWQGREADHSPPVSADFKKAKLYLHSPTRLHGLVLNYLSTGTALPLPCSQTVMFLSVM
jgi:hypothetical protein